MLLFSILDDDSELVIDLFEYYDGCNTHNSYVMPYVCQTITHIETVELFDCKIDLFEIQTLNRTMALMLCNGKEAKKPDVLRQLRCLIAN